MLAHFILSYLINIPQIKSCVNVRAGASQAGLAGATSSSRAFVARFMLLVCRRERVRRTRGGHQAPGRREEGGWAEERRSDA